MKLFKISIPVIAITLFTIACNTERPPQTVLNEPVPNIRPADNDSTDYWAKDNLDLQRVGDLLARSKDPRQFEEYLNSADGINNLDLNGDGYVDYIGVREYEDRNDNERGLSLFSRFGPDLIQEIAQIVLYREDPRAAGARVLLRGNDQLYGDNNYYETNWTDRTIGLVSTLFGNRSHPYQSPYYYDNYPPSYQAYQVVETPLYRERIQRLYPQPVFVTVADPLYFNRIKIKSPNNGLHLGQIKARLVKPTKEQEDFFKNNPRTVVAVKVDKDKGSKDQYKDLKNDDRGNDRKNETPGINPGKMDKQDGDKNKPSNPNKGDDSDKNNSKRSTKGNVGDKGNGKNKP